MEPKDAFLTELRERQAARDKVNAEAKRQADDRLEATRKAEVAFYKGSTFEGRLAQLVNLVAELVTLKQKSQEEKYKLYATMESLRFQKLVPFLQNDVGQAIVEGVTEHDGFTVTLQDDRGHAYDVKVQPYHTVIDLCAGIAAAWQIPVPYVSLHDAKAEVEGFMKRLDYSSLLLQVYSKVLTVYLYRPQEDPTLSLYPELNQFLLGATMGYMLCLKGHSIDVVNAFGRKGDSMYHAFGCVWGLINGRVATEEEAYTFLNDFGVPLKVEYRLPGLELPEEIGSTSCFTTSDHDEPLRISVEKPSEQPVEHLADGVLDKKDVVKVPDAKIFRPTISRHEYIPPAELMGLPKVGGRKMSDDNRGQRYPVTPVAHGRGVGPATLHNGLKAKAPYFFVTVRIQRRDKDTVERWLVFLVHEEDIIDNIARGTRGFYQDLERDFSHPVIRLEPYVEVLGSPESGTIGVRVQSDPKDLDRSAKLIQFQDRVLKLTYDSH